MRGGRDAWAEAVTHERRPRHVGGGRDVWEERVVGPPDQRRMREARDTWIRGRKG